MSAIVMDGRRVAAEIKKEIADELSDMDTQKLVIIRVGNDFASKKYVDAKKRDALECGIDAFELHFDEGVETHTIINAIHTFTSLWDTYHILVQLPLPDHIDTRDVIQAIPPHLDVDGFTYEATGALWHGGDKALYVPCTPAGIMELLDYYLIDIEGKHAVIIGRSDIVGKPMAALLLARDATVTICHSHTEGLREICRQADILVVACGQAKMVTVDYVKKGAVVIDVGMDRDEDGKLCGDVDFDSVKEVASYITPVPGGVGPMTRAMLMRNVAFG